MNKFKLVALAAVELHNKYTDYTSLQFSQHSDGTETWNIYTPVINHNAFDTAEEAITFMRKVIEDGSELYAQYRMDELKREKASAQERLDDINEEMERLEATDAEEKV